MAIITITEAPARAITDTESNRIGAAPRLVRWCRCSRVRCVLAASLRTRRSSPPWGVGVALSEAEHAALLVACIALSLGLAAREAMITRRWGSIFLTVVGCGALITAHVLEATPAAAVWLPRIGIAFLLGGAVWGQRIRSGARRPAFESEPRSATIAEPAP